MKILVSGGTGFIGQAVVKALLSKGYPVRTLSRHPKSADGFAGDITKPETLLRPLEGIETVIQCTQFPGHPVENQKKGYTYWQVDAVGTENLAKAAKAAGVKHFIYLSGAGTDGKKTEPWFKAKWHAEQAIRNSGIVATILRPSWAYGPGDKSLNRIISILRKFPIFPLLGGGKNHIQPIFIENLAEIVALSVDYKDNYRIFDVGGPEEMTNKEMTQRVAKVLRKKIFFFPLPIPPFAPKFVNFLTMDVKIDITPLKKAFPQVKLKTLEEGLKTYL